jgi:hypothetical protein
VGPFGIRHCAQVRSVVQTPLLHTPFAPQSVPFAAFPPESAQTGTPEPHAMTPVWHWFVGEHDSPAMHELQDPLLQTSFVPQLAPFETLVPVSVQVAVPDAHDESPVWQGFAGVHAVFAVHAEQLPLSQTSFVPQLVPFARLLPVAQTGAPDVQTVEPVWQATLGVQTAPAVQGEQVPLSQTVLTPQLVPFGRDAF